MNIRKTLFGFISAALVCMIGALGLHLNLINPALLMVGMGLAALNLAYLLAERGRTVIQAECDVASRQHS